MNDTMSKTPIDKRPEIMIFNFAEKAGDPDELADRALKDLNEPSAIPTFGSQPAPFFRRVELSDSRYDEAVDFVITDMKGRGFETRLDDRARVRLGYDRPVASVTKAGKINSSFSAIRLIEALLN